MAPSLQPATEKVNPKFDASIREREGQALNIKLKLADEETADTLRAGSLFREEQFSINLLMFVTAAVL